MKSECSFVPQIKEKSNYESLSEDNQRRDSIQFILRHQKANNIRKQIQKLYEPRNSMTGAQIKEVNLSSYMRNIIEDSLLNFHLLKRMGK